jgi:RNA polymerase sigma-70 factor, ECF subfamily
MKLGRWRSGPGLASRAAASSATASRVAASKATAGRATIDPETAQRFRDAALPHLDEAYTLARYLLRNADDAEDAVQECYLRALRHFDSFQGPAIKPWLMAILRNVCRAEYARRTSAAVADAELDEAVVPLWQEPQQSPEHESLRRKDGEAIRGLLDGLPEPFREILVLREINDLSYRDIASVIGAPIGTVMSRLARARTLLRDAWLAGGHEEKT